MLTVCLDLASLCTALDRLFPAPLVVLIIGIKLNKLPSKSANDESNINIATIAHSANSVNLPYQCQLKLDRVP